MTIRLVLSFMLLASLVAKGQTVNKVVFDEDAQQEILLGFCNYDAFLLPQFRSWYEPEYEAYAPNHETIGRIIKVFNGETMNEVGVARIRIILGTWCSDSQREVPRLLKVLDFIDFQKDKIDIIGVNRKKIAPEAGIDEGYVDFVPTVIILFNGSEIGRIIETPDKTLEEDILEIFSRIK